MILHEKEVRTMTVPPNTSPLRRTPMISELNRLAFGRGDELAAPAPISRRRAVNLNIRIQHQHIEFDDIKRRNGTRKMSPSLQKKNPTKESPSLSKEYQSPSKEAIKPKEHRGNCW